MRARNICGFSWVSAVVFTACASDAPPREPTVDVPYAEDARDASTTVAPRAACTYTNPFSMSEECKEYVDSAWVDATMGADCTNSRGMLRVGATCNYPQVLGRCEVRASGGAMTRIVFPGADASRCAITRTGCMVFARGVFTAAGVCAGADAGAPPDDAAVSTPRVFQQPTRECRAPRAGERPGTSPGGQVCTWSAISAATEEGRRYQDYASCERVRTQRPYYAASPGKPRGEDARMRDPAYVAELAWVRSQIEASACVCCHSSRIAPEGPSNWYIEAPGNWMDSFYDTGLALGAGWVDSSSFGEYPASENNGFARNVSGVPSTDSERMARFFRAELQHRGRTRESFASAPPFGGPIYTQQRYVPSACTGTDGVGADGIVRWTGGGARYLYVLDEGSANPGVPPNFDLPAGTRWRVDVPFTGAPFASGVTYGRAPEGSSQRFPTSGAPRPLLAGTRYYLYVLADVGIPITRCLFTAR